MANLSKVVEEGKNSNTKDRSKKSKGNWWYFQNYGEKFTLVLLLSK
jgi:hypothetical protein